MPIDKIYEVICDGCGSGIDYLRGTKESVKRQTRDEGTIVIGDKCFCNDECKQQFPESETLQTTKQ